MPDGFELTKLYPQWCIPLQAMAKPCHCNSISIAMKWLAIYKNRPLLRTKKLEANGDSFKLSELLPDDSWQIALVATVFWVSL